MSELEVSRTFTIDSDLHQYQPHGNQLVPPPPPPRGASIAKKSEGTPHKKQTKGSKKNGFGKGKQQKTD